MRRFSHFLSIVSILSAPLLLHGQELKITTDPGVLARLEYATSAATERGDLRHVCVAITLDGEYQIIRSTIDKPTEYLRGQLSKDRFDRLKTLLSSKEFRSQSGTLGGLIRQDSENFRAEMPRPLKKRADATYLLPEREAWRLEWLNADNTAPFPHSISKVVHWLQSFAPKNGKEFSYADFPNVCPSGGLRLVQPSVADNQRP
jgi:hypothetical protein